MNDYIDINYENNMKTLSEAIKYCDEVYTHKDIINELTLDNDIKKQLCIIELKELKSQEEANILVSNLTQHSGPIRETTSSKILDLIILDDYKKYFQTKEILDIFTKGITDINPTVSRNVVEIIKYVENSDYLVNNIIKEINQTFKEMEDVKKYRSYDLNKKNFNLYWNLEALISLADKIILDEKLINIIKITSSINDYTIREKTAKLVFLFKKNNLLKEIIEKLKTDENIYVSKYFNI